MARQTKPPPGADRSPGSLSQPLTPPHQPAAEDARSRLLRAGLRLFAAQGFSKTSTREVAEAAGTNVASIAYYFGDKAGLYRAVFFEPLGPMAPDFEAPASSGEPRRLDQDLRRFYTDFLAPLKSGEQARLCIKLRFREILEPSGLWQQEVSGAIRPMHEHLLRLLCRVLPAPEPDDDVQRLAMCLAGLGVHLHVGGDVVDALAPQLLDGPASIDRWVERLTTYAIGMIDAERQRRAQAGAATP